MEQTHLSFPFLFNFSDFVCLYETFNLFIKKYFYRKIEKNYSSFAYTTTILHEKIKNNTAYQNFTKNGPIAFLPVSDCETSIVYSLKSLDKKIIQK